MLLPVKVEADNSLQNKVISIQAYIIYKHKPEMMNILLLVYLI